MPNVKTFSSAADQENWLESTANLLAILTEVLANRLRGHFLSLPARAVVPVCGYITPVAAEFVRRAIWSDSLLSSYQKAQLFLFMLGSYEYVAVRYQGQLPPLEQCLNELPLLMPPSSPSFVTRVSKVKSIYDECFLPKNRRDLKNNETIFAGGLLEQIAAIVRDHSGTVPSPNQQGIVHLLNLLESTNATVHNLLLAN